MQGLGPQDGGLHLGCLALGGREDGGAILRTNIRALTVEGGWGHG